MVIDEFLVKLMKKDYANLMADDFCVIKDNDSIFGLTKNLDSFKEFERNKDEIIKVVESSIPLRLSIIEKLDENPIIFDRKEIDCRTIFFDNLERMSVIKMCYFIDTICKLRKKKKLAFFGNYANNEIVYHELNMVISKGNGLTLAFQVFGEGKFNNLRFLGVDLAYVDKNGFIDVFKRNTRRYFYILNCVAEIILEYKDEEMPKKVSTAKKIKSFIEAIDDDKKHTTPKGKKYRESWVYSDDGVMAEPIDEGDDDA